MKLIVDREMMLANVERAELLCSSPIALMFKDFYADMYDSRFAKYNCFSNSNTVLLNITANIGHKAPADGKVITNLQELYKYKGTLKRLYVPINMLDNREGVDITTAKKLFEEFGDKDNAYVMITSGCISEYAPELQYITDTYNEFRDIAKNISVGGSYYLQRYIPSYINEVRIGEYMLFGTIPYCNNRELFGTPALIFQTEVIEVYPERKQILVDGGTSSINAKDSTLLSGGLQYSNASCDYTIYNDPFGKYKVGNIIEMIPDYNSLKLMRNVAREYC